MGLAASQCRLLMIVARKSDLEFQIQCINQRRMTLAQQATNLSRQIANNVYQTGNWVPYGPDVTINNDGTMNGGYALPGVTDIFAPGGVNGEQQVVQTSPIASGTYEQQLTIVHAMDKELELEEKNLDTQHKCVETEYDAVKKVIDKNIETSFKTLG